MSLSKSKNLAYLTKSIGFGELTKFIDLVRLINHTNFTNPIQCTDHPRYKRFISFTKDTKPARSIDLARFISLKRPAKLTKPKKSTRYRDLEEIYECYKSHKSRCKINLL